MRRRVSRGIKTSSRTGAKPIFMLKLGSKKKKRRKKMCKYAILTTGDEKLGLPAGLNGL